MRSKLFFLFFLTSIAFAGITPFGKIEGKIVKMDAKTITLQLEDGRQKTVNRKDVSKKFNLKPNAKVVVYIDMSTIVSNKK